MSHWFCTAYMFCPPPDCSFKNSPLMRITLTHCPCTVFDVVWHSVAFQLLYRQILHFLDRKKVLVWANCQVVLLNTIIGASLVSLSFFLSFFVIYSVREHESLPHSNNISRKYDFFKKWRPRNFFIFKFTKSRSV